MFGWIFWYGSAIDNSKDRISQSGLLVAQKGTPKVRTSQEGLLVANVGTPKVRTSQEGFLVANIGSPKVRTSQIGLLAITQANSNVRVSQEGLLVITKGIAYSRSITDTLTITPTLADTHIGVKSITDTLTFTQNASYDHAKSLTQTLTFTQTTSGIRTKVESVTDTLTFSDFEINSTDHIRVVNDTFLITQALGNFKIIHDTLTITPTLTAYAVRSRSITDSLVFTETTTKHHIANRSIADTLTFTQSGVGNKGLSVNQTLVFTPTVSVIHVRPVPTITQTLVLTQTVAKEKIYGIQQGILFLDYLFRQDIGGRTVNDTLVFNQTASIDYLNAEHIQDTLTLNDSVSFKLWHYSSTIDTLVFNQTVSKLHTATERIVDDPTLTYTQTVIGVKSHPSTNTLVFSQSVQRQHIQHKNVFDKLNLTDSITSKSLKTRNVLDLLHFEEIDYKLRLDINGGLFVTRPVATVVVIKPNVINTRTSCTPITLDYIVLSSTYGSVTLPPPEFGDTETQQNSVNVKRTMTNHLITYVKTNKRLGIHWPFLLTRAQVKTLQVFLDANIGEVMNIYDWRGRIYVGFISNDSITFTSKRRLAPCSIEQVEVALDFQGFRVKG